MFQAAEVLNDAGVITRGIRSTFHGPTLKAYLASDKGKSFKQLLWENADNPFEIFTRTKQSTCHFIASLTIIRVPIILVFTHSVIFYSTIGTCLTAAA